MVVCLLEMVSDDSQGATVNIATSQPATFRSHVYQFSHAVLLRWRTVAKRVVQWHVQCVTNSVNRPHVILLVG